MERKKLWALALAVFAAILIVIIPVAWIETEHRRRPTDTAMEDVPVVLKPSGQVAGKPVKPATTLRILGVGDSITWGWLSQNDGGDGNGYRAQLKQDLSMDKVVFVGTETSNGTMADARFAAWPATTINFVTDHVGPSLKFHPNIVLVHAGTNDMNPNPAVSTEGNDPAGAINRLNDLVHTIALAVPDAVILVAMIISTCDPNQQPRTVQYRSLIPGMVTKQRKLGIHSFAVDFSTFSTDDLRGDCIHPTNAGYRVMGDFWYDALTQVPSNWINYRAA